MPLGISVYTSNGIKIENSNGILIQGCLIENNKYSLSRISPSPDPSHKRRGILNVLEGDTTFTDTLTGIYAYNSEISLKNNKIINNFTGLYATGFLNLISKGNIIKNNIWHGYDMAVSNSSNLVFENDILTNRNFLYIIKMEFLKMEVDYEEIFNCNGFIHRVSFFRQFKCADIEHIADCSISI